MSFNNSSRRRPGRQQSRRGTAAVELAVCLPMLALLVFGSIQACNLIYLKHAITSAAYEGTLELVRPNATNDSVKARINQVLTMHEVKGATVTILPKGSQLATELPGTPIKIRVRAKVAPNQPLSGWFPSPKRLDYTIVGPR